MRRLALTTAAALVLISPAPAADPKPDSPAIVKAKLADKSAVLLDVREGDEWAAGHLADATHLALSRLKAGVPATDLAKLVPKDKIVYLHCRSGVRSAKAATLLKPLGYDARPLKAGFDDLTAAGFPVAPADKK